MDTAMKTDAIEAFYNVAVAEGAYTNIPNLKNHLAYIFDGVSLAGKRVLDVGGGTGLLTLWAAANGASAVCLEPESAGSTRAVRETFNRLKASIDPNLDATMLSQTLQEFLATPGPLFDVVVMANSVNHLDEASAQSVLTDPKAAQAYVDLFGQLKQRMARSGVVVLTDCGRRNFFGDLGLRSPIMPSIDWTIHQSPQTWFSLLSKAGFTDRKISWTTPNSFGRLGQLVLGNPLASYFLFSHFRLFARAA